MRINSPRGVVEYSPALRLVIATVFLFLAVILFSNAITSASTRTTYLSDCSSTRAKHVLACEFFNELLRAIPEGARWILSVIGETVGAVIFLYAAFQLFSSTLHAKRDS